MRRDFEAEEAAVDDFKRIRFGIEDRVWVKQLIGAGWNPKKLLFVYYIKHMCVVLKNPPTLEVAGTKKWHRLRGITRMLASGANAEAAQIVDARRAQLDDGLDFAAEHIAEVRAQADEHAPALKRKAQEAGLEPEDVKKAERAIHDAIDWVDKRNFVNVHLQK